ncbi:formylglycine-generating enzyme family protein [Roseovarius sp. S1116L3]|uniref:formylglycine-generating enzyme family protein n=1 Tax=Roseovarius roseus TaxID=3342636 RepID=UPI00372D270B
MSTLPLSSKPILLLAVGVVAAVIAFGAAQILRGPTPSLAPLPEMAAAPVTLPDGAPLYVQRYEVTLAEWGRCHADGACTLALRGRADLDPATTPATGLSYMDAAEYLRWINHATGHDFRLPTASEWEHMARPVLPHSVDPIFTDPSLQWASSYLTEGLAPRALRPQGSFASSPEGIADLDGSVWEWTQECYAGADAGIDPERCPAYFVGGEHVSAMSFLIRDPARGGCAVGAPPAHLGMRLVSDKPV